MAKSDGMNLGVDPHQQFDPPPKAIVKAQRFDERPRGSNVVQ
jgi:hypothetical protein